MKHMCVYTLDQMCHICSCVCKKSLSVTMHPSFWESHTTWSTQQNLISSCLNSTPEIQILDASTIIALLYVSTTLASSFTVASAAEGHLLVPSEDPDFDASVSQALNGLWHSSLQLVLNGGAAQQQQLALYQVSNRCQLLLTPFQGCLGLKVFLLPPALMTTVMAVLAPNCCHLHA